MKKKQSIEEIKAAATEVENLHEIFRRLTPDAQGKQVKDHTVIYFCQQNSYLGALFSDLLKDTFGDDSLAELCRGLIIERLGEVKAEFSGIDFGKGKKE